MCWIVAQTSKREGEFVQLAYPPPKLDWFLTSLHYVLGEARIATGLTPDGRVLPCAGVLIDFERRVYVR